MTKNLKNIARRAAQKTSGEERTYRHTELVALLRAINSHTVSDGNDDGEDWGVVESRHIIAEFAKMGVEL